MSPKQMYKLLVAAQNASYLGIGTGPFGGDVSQIQSADISINSQAEETGIERHSSC